MTSTNITVLKIMNVLFWIVFIGLCIETGALLISFCVSLFISPASAKGLYMSVNLSKLYEYSKSYYIQIVSLIISLNGLKAFIAYLVVRIFIKFDFSKPFNPDVTALIATISHVALGTGIIAIVGSGTSEWLVKRGIAVPINWGGGEILFFAGVIYIIANVFKKGTELQTESDLTI